jgi:hypothetical protein
VSDGTRTRDRRDHNPELYQLSYAHQESTQSSSARAVGLTDPLARPWDAPASRPRLRYSHRAV